MWILKKIGKVMRDPGILLLCLIQTPCISSIIPDKLYLKTVFRLRTHKKLNLQNPKTFNEKLQWLKLYDRKPEYSMMVDKYAVRQYISDKIGEEYLIPLLGAWNNPDNIDFASLPNQFVLKCNHNSGLGMCICKDKSKLDINKVKRELKKGLKQDYYLTGREWPYKNVKPKIIAEKYINDDLDPNGGIVDYKVLCFNGKAKYIELHLGRSGKHHTQDFYDINWNKTDISQGEPNSERTVPKPGPFEKMIELSEKLAEGIRQVRIDWYIVGEKLYFGEVTFYDGSGFCPFDKDEDDIKFGNLINLN